MHKAGTVAEMLALKGKMPESVYTRALHIVKILDEQYGANRDIDNGDGGFVFIAETQSDLHDFSENYMRLDQGIHEAVALVPSDRGQYLDVLFLCNNEFGINLFIPISIAPKALLKEISGKIKR